MRRRTMTVMRDEMNWPMAEIIKKVSDQNLRGRGLSGNEEIWIIQRDSQAVVDWVRTANAIDGEDEQRDCCKKSKHNPGELS
jgi:hypothetical protein